MEFTESRQQHCKSIIDTMLDTCITETNGFLDLAALTVAQTGESTYHSRFNILNRTLVDALNKLTVGIKDWKASRDSIFAVLELDDAKELENSICNDIVSRANRAPITFKVQQQRVILAERSKAVIKRICASRSVIVSEYDELYAICNMQGQSNKYYYSLKSLLFLIKEFSLQRLDAIEQFFTTGGNASAMTVASSYFG